MSKVTVVGAGNVGATCANVLAVNEVANEVCLIDIKEGFDILRLNITKNFSDIQKINFFVDGKFGELSSR